MIAEYNGNMSLLLQNGGSGDARRLPDEIPLQCEHLWIVVILQMTLETIDAISQELIAQLLIQDCSPPIQMTVAWNVLLETERTTKSCIVSLLWKLVIIIEYSFLFFLSDCGVTMFLVWIRSVRISNGLKWLLMVLLGSLTKKFWVVSHAPCKDFNCVLDPSSLLGALIKLLWILLRQPREDTSGRGTLSWEEISACTSGLAKDSSYPLYCVTFLSVSCHKDLGVGRWTNHKLRLYLWAVVGTLTLVTVQQHFTCNSRVIALWLLDTVYYRRVEFCERIMGTMKMFLQLNDCEVFGSGSDGYGNGKMLARASGLATDSYYSWIFRDTSLIAGCGAMWGYGGQSVYIANYICEANCILDAQVQR
ncbi:hypothetical protein MKX03_011851 [Papaver bracteatum]|nr:hypothetical protein MKX03_011851 [Papaver bracteatum]